MEDSRSPVSDEAKSRTEVCRKIFLDKIGHVLIQAEKEGRENLERRRRDIKERLVFHGIASSIIHDNEREQSCL